MGPKETNSEFNFLKFDQLASLQAIKIIIRGVVQGVGFRPFIHRLAERLAFTGWVRNTGQGVEIHLEKFDAQRLLEFLSALKKDKPPLASLEEINLEPDNYENWPNFSISTSKSEETFAFISPDVATCDDCYQEIMDPAERRYRYPFTNCTNCGPRYTIVENLPYDRSRTTMASFPMCSSCAEEYHNPLDRRFHAQPIACPICGPQVQLVEAASGQIISGGISKAAQLLKDGFIVAVKGLGGFHLMADARNEKAIGRLRQIKARRFKPLALMARDFSVVEKIALVNLTEKEWLTSASRPIILLQKKEELPGIAPHLKEIGLMLPYTPLHHLLLQEIDLVVATSSNRKDAPIIKEEKEGIAELCDYLLTHNRPIAMRADDSVLKIVANEPLFLRRARGFVPYPERIDSLFKIDTPILAVGGELKVTISIYKKGTVVTSQFLGDLDEYENYLYFEETINHFFKLFDFKPLVIVSDLHPNFRTTLYARKTGLPHFQVQHHYAHILASFLEHRLPPETRVLGISFDGYGYGTDGAAWGGEFLLATGAEFKRLAHFAYVPLPGGDLAARQPWRMALAHLLTFMEPESNRLASLLKVEKSKIEIVLEAIRKKINSPLTSSCGRLFDAVAWLLGVAPEELEFEAEAAMRLETLASAQSNEVYPYKIKKNNYPWEISLAPLFEAIIRDRHKGESLEKMATKFHRTLAEIIVDVCRHLYQDFHFQVIVIGGGVFLNRWLTMMTTELLRHEGFQVLRPLRYSPNDESLSLGQIYYALCQLKQQVR
ncbi:MAG: carbamoyltransferase HypF [Candidatus Aminicenantes bacterium]|nr:carbamoyltransferase HypF [Candidatus Aminicenantes bacterium]